MLVWHWVQLSFSCYFLFLLECLIIYNLYQTYRQSQLIYFLGYKMFLIIFIGYILIYFDLDIITLFLWMIYGGFLSIVLIMSFLWVDNTVYIFKVRLFKFFFYTTLALIYVYYSLYLEADHNSWIIWNIGWINYYEVLEVDLGEELEVLGWGLGFENNFVLLLIAALLTMACICIVFIVVLGRTIRSASVIYILNRLNYSNNWCNFIFLKNQSIFLQEYRLVSMILRNFKLFHSRRL